MSQVITQSTRRSNGRSCRLLCGVSLSAFALLALPSPSHAAERWWDPNAFNPGSGGNGNWDTSSSVWGASDSDVLGLYFPWDNAALDDATFGTTSGTVTAGTVTLTEPITVHNLKFQTVHGWVLNGSTLTLAGTTPTITATTDVTINSVIAGTAGLTKAGGRILSLTGTNTFSGGITLTGGYLYADDNLALGDLSNNISVTGGSTLRISSGSTARTISIADGVTLGIQGVGTGSAFYTGDGNLLADSSAGNLTLSNDSNNYKGTTTLRGHSGVGTVSFTSVRNLGEASALGAPENETDGTITLSQVNNYTDVFAYVGDGDTSNRNWVMTGAARFYNNGTGTLTLTGTISTGSTITAGTADFELLGEITSGGLFAASTAGRTITLGGNNSYTGATSISAENATATLTVVAPVLANSGVNSSLGRGSLVNLGNGGTLSYTGAAASSNRSWTAEGTTAILNNGTGALTLSGPLAFQTPLTADNLTLGGTFAGTNSFSGVMSGSGGLTSNGAGTWVLSGANTRTGTITVESGILRAGSASAFGTTTGVTVNNGTLDLNGFDLLTPSLNGTGGSVALGAATLTVNGAGASNYGGSIAGDGGLNKAGAGTLALTGANTYTGTTSIAGGTLRLDFGAAGAPADNIISTDSTLAMAGGRLEILGSDTGTNSQSFDGLSVTAGSNRIIATSGAGGGTLNVDLGTITRTGGLVDFVLPTNGAITTDSATLGGWATVNQTDYAKVVGNVITAFEESDYTDQDDASLWTSGLYISDSDGDADSYFGTVGSSIQLAGLQFTTPDATTIVTIAPGQTLGVDGAIIVAPSVLTNNQTITGGSLTGSVGGGILGVLQNGGGNFIIESTITNNGAGVVGFTKGGAGLVTLSGTNTYTGVTTVSGGTLSVNSVGNGGAASAIGASAADSSNLVLEGGTLRYTGGSATTNRGFTLVNGSVLAPVVEIMGTANLTFTGQVTSPDDAGLTKAGAGTLTLANATNNYIGVTTINGGVLSVGTLANGGLASGIGAASSASANLVLAGGALQYTGGNVTIDRGFTLGSGNGRIDVSGAAVLNIGGTAVGTGGLYKDGTGTLVLSGTNTYTGDTVVTAGTLRAGSTQAFGIVPTALDAQIVTVNAGAVLDLNGNANSIGALSGAGNVTLGSATLTTMHESGSFSGTISGTGGLTRSGGWTQTMVGCNNTYTGVTTINGGVLSIDCLANGGLASGIGASSNASSNLVITNGTLVYSGGDILTNRGFTMGAGISAIDVVQSDTALQFSGIVTGTGHLRKQGAGTLILSGANNYTGNTHVLGGVLQAGSATAFGNTASFQFSDVAGAVIDMNDFSSTTGYLTGGGTLGGDLDMGSGNLTLNLASGTASFGGEISGTGNFIKSGGAGFVQNLTNCNSSYTGATTINGGTLGVQCLANGGVNSTIGASSAAPSNLVLNGGTLRYIGTAAASTDRQFTLGTAGGGLASSGTGLVNFTYTGAITTAGAGNRTLTLSGTNSGDNILAAQIVNPTAGGVTSLTKTEAGTWRLTNAGSTYTGVTTISGGVLSVDKLANGTVASSIGMSTNAATNLVIGSGGTLRYTGTGDTTDRLFQLQRGTTAIESSGSGAIVFSSNGAVAFSSAGTGARVLSLGGTYAGDNIMGATIGNESAAVVTALAKSGPGKWILTGTNTYTGNTNVNGGTLVIGNGGTTGSIQSAVSSIAAGAVLGFNRSDSVTFGGLISGAGAVHQLGTGTTILTGTNTYTGGTTIAQGTLQLGNGGATGSIVGNVTNNGALTFNRNNSYTFAGVISGTGVVNQAGTGTTILTGASTYTGGTNITAGTLQIGSGGTTGSITGNVVNNAALAFNRSNDLTFGGTISGTGTLTKLGAGVLTLTADNSYTGLTTISAGTLQIGNGGTTGSIAGNILNNGALTFNRSNALSYGGLISGTGTLNKTGAGILTLTGNNSYTGPTNVNAGTLLVNGIQSGMGLTSVASGATLGGTGTIGGNVTVAGGGILAPGAGGAGTLSIAGNLSLAGTSVLNMEFGAAGVVGGPLNDLIDVGGNLTLDGTLNVTQSTGGIFGAGVYRVISYDGTLTNNGLALGTMPDGSVTVLQTSIAGQVNLINTAGLSLSYWDGAAGPKFNGVVDGGDGTWQNSSGNDNWTDAAGSFNAPYDDGTFAIFQGAAGTVTIDNGLGAVTASALQFFVDGYRITGGTLTLTDAQSQIRVGDGTALGAGYVATIESEIAGAAQLVKTELGTLVLSGTNSYTGGTLIDAGTLQISSDANLGDTAGGLSIDGGTLRTTADMTSARTVALDGAGTFLTDAATTLTLSGIVSGAGALTKDGAGTLVLTNANTYSGGTTITAGTLQLGDGGTTGSILGDVANDGIFAFDRSDSFTFGGVVSGSGAVDQIGVGTTILTAANTYTGGTNIAAGTLQIGDGGTTGSIMGDVANEGILAFNRSDEMTFAGVISGDGDVNQIGAGTTILTAANTYLGATNVDAGILLVNGDQSAATGLTSVALGATLGGIGTIGGDVDVDGTLAPGSNDVGTLTINGNLSLAGTALLDYELGAANVVGGSLNDLMEVDGNLVLDGTIDVTVPSGGNFDVGVYRVINYSGTLTDNGLEVGSVPPGNDVLVQTVVPGQVNLINAGALTLNFWDGDAGPKSNDIVNGGNGTWHLGGTDSNWTDSAGAFNSAYSDGSFAIFQGAAGIVSVDNGLGPVTASGMQFVTSGYEIAGQPLTLVGPQSLIRVGDGTAAGTATSALISAELTGATQLVKGDLGTLILSGTNSYTGGTLIDVGTLQISSDANLGLSGTGLGIDGGTLHTTATFASARAVDLAGDGIFLTDTGTILTLEGAVSGVGALAKDGDGTLILTADNGYAGGTTITAGTLQLGNGGTTGTILGDVVNEGVLAFNRSNGLTFAGLISGDGAVNQIGMGTTILTGANAYLGATNVNAGTLLINGDQSLATGLTSVASGATLGGIGIIGGSVAINGGTLAAGSEGVGLLTINGGLSLDGASTLAMEFGAANVVGGPLNDLIDVGGDLVLDGTINVTVPATGSFGIGVYRAINYGGVLTDNGLALGTMPEGSDVFVQTSVLGQVNLVNSGGATLTFWDGDAGPKFNRAVDGGDGLWQNSSGNDNWTESTGALNGEYTDGAFAIFMAAPGIVSVDNSLGNVTTSGMQFASDGYVINGDVLTLVGAEALIRVGDGSTAGADYVATIDAQLTGTSQLVKDDAGTLILTGSNSYTGGTIVNAGKLIIQGDQSAATGLMSVLGGTMLGGTGIIGGDVVVADGGTVAPGESPGTLTILGDFTLNAGSVLDFEFGEANVVGGPLNDLIEVGGDLVLDGTLNVATAAGGTFGAGIYRVINYGGALTDNGLDLGLMPAGSDTFLQVSVAGQVNLINTAGLTLNFWDGEAGPKFDGVVNGGDGLWQNATGNDNWTDMNGALNAPYTDGGFAIFSAAAGIVQVDNSLGNVTSSGMQFASDGYRIEGDVLTLVGPQAIIRVGDGTTEGEDFVATIDAELAGLSQLVKTDGGTLVLTGTNSYAGGTAINGGTLEISSDANLGAAAGDLSFDGGTLHTTADINTARDALFTGAGTFLTDEDTTFGFNGVVSGAGALTKAGAGTLVLTADSSGYTGAAQLLAGTTVVNGTLGGTMDVRTGARLEGTGIVGATANHAGAMIAPGGQFGTLTVDGAYTGSGGTLEIETALGGDASSTDKLVITGATSGTTNVTLINRDGLGAATQEGIKIVDVGGASNGIFTLTGGDYLFQGQQAIVAGAYGYTLNKNGVANPGDGDWYLRSSFANGEAGDPLQPIYQPGVPVYEGYAQSMQALNGLGTLRQRVGTRQWSSTEGAASGSGMWGRIEAASARPDAKFSSSLVDSDIDTWKAQVGIDHVLHAGGNGTLVGAITGHYGEADVEIGSVFGSGDIDTKGYGLGATLTYYGGTGFYVDAQAQFSWYKSDLRSDIFGELVEDNDGKGQAFGIEIGKKFALGSKLAITPQAQLVYSNVDFDAFTDDMGAEVSSVGGDSLKSRFGIAIERQDVGQDASGRTRQSRLYGVANLSYEWLDGLRTDVSGARIVNRDERLWGELGLGGSYSWDRISLFGEVSANTSIENFGDSYSLKGTAGIRIRF